MSKEGERWGDFSPGHITDIGWIQHYQSQHCVRVQEVHKEQRVYNITDHKELDEKAAKCEEITP